jgi:type IV secretory pathway VirB10-like protein
VSANDATTQTDESTEKPAGHRSKLIIFLSILFILVLIAMAWSVNNKVAELDAAELTQAEGGDSSDITDEEKEAKESVQSNGLVNYFYNMRGGKGLPTVDETNPELLNGGNKLSATERYTKNLSDSEKFDIDAYLAEIKAKKEADSDDMASLALQDDVGSNVTDAGISIDPPTSTRQSNSVNGSVSSSTSQRRSAIRQRLEDAKARLSDVRNGAGQGASPVGANTIYTDSPTTTAEVNSELTGRGFDDEGEDPDGMLIPPTTVIDAMLNQRVNTDLPSNCIGLTRHNVYNSERTHILIPHGSKVGCVIRQYKGANQPIQNRVAMGVSYIVRPDNVLIKLDNLDGLNFDGTGGIQGDVDRHIFAQTMGTIAYAVIGAGPELAFDGNTEDTGDLAQAELLSNVSGQFQPLASKYLSIVPTVTLERGTPFKIVLDTSLKVKPYSEIKHVNFGRL